MVDVDIGEELRLRRMLSRLRQYQVAQAASIPQATLCQFEWGKRIPSPELAKKICQAIEQLASREVKHEIKNRQPGNSKNERG